MNVRLKILLGAVDSLDGLFLSPTHLPVNEKKECMREASRFFHFFESLCPVLDMLKIVQSGRCDVKHFQKGLGAANVG